MSVKEVKDQLQISNLRNDMRDINYMAAEALRERDEDVRQAKLRIIMRITREAIYR